MRESTILVLAIALLAGIFLIGNLNLTGKAVTGKSSCEYSGGSIFDSKVYVIEDINIYDKFPAIKYYNKCATKTAVARNFCRYNKRTQEPVECPEGYVCEQDRCVLGVETEGEINCYDTDGGSIYKKGETIVRDGLGVGIPETSSDGCATSSSLTESTCTAHDKIRKYTIDCPSQKCVDGACVR